MGNLLYMGDTLLKDKIRLLEAERQAIIEPWQSLGSPTTIQSVHDRVEKEVGWNPSWNTIKKDVEFFRQEGWVEMITMPGGQTIIKPNENKLKGWQKIDFEEIFNKEKGVPK